MKHLVIYVYCKGGSAEEEKHYQPLFAESNVIGFDYKSQNPCEAKIDYINNNNYEDLHTNLKIGKKKVYFL